MIAHLRGKLIYKNPGQAMIEAAGVGYDVTISVPTFTALPSQGAEASLHIHTQVKRLDGPRCFSWDPSNRGKKQASRFPT